VNVIASKGEPVKKDPTKKPGLIARVFGTPKPPLPPVQFNVMRVVRYEHGDVFVLRTQGRMTPDQQRNVKDSWIRQMGRAPLFILGPGMELELVKGARDDALPEVVEGKEADGGCGGDAPAQAGEASAGAVPQADAPDRVS
jgi:hypothetical protein